MKLSARPLPDLLAAFRSSEPTPGGGSAAALAGAVGASLLAMVAGLARPRTTSADDLQRLAAAGARCAELSERLAALIDQDSDAYDLVVGAFRLPKGSDEEKRARGSAIQTAMHAATNTPLVVMRSCADAIAEAAVVAAFGNANASSDVAVALELLGAALRGAKVNVEINLESVKDEAFAATARADAERVAAAAAKGTAAARARLTNPA